jgi:class 3 adenylate cyclase
VSRAVLDKLSLDEFRQLHPWPAAQRALGRPLEWLWQFELPAAPDAVWRSIGDTERTNRATGLTTLRYQEVAGELIGSHMTAGVRHEFVERWEWVTGSTIELVREYRTGLARVMRNIYRFDPGGPGTRLSIYYGWIARGGLGSIAIRAGMFFYGRRFRSLVDRVRAEMARVGAAGSIDPVEVMRQPGPALDRDRRLRIARLRDELRGRGVDSSVLDRVVELAVSGDDLELDRIRVRRLARDWGLDEKLVIRAALHATRAGLLQLTWDVMCPHCRGVRQKLSSLGDVPERGDCDVCAVDFGTDGENAVEVTFRVHPSIRAVQDLVYCSAQPVRRSHVRLQQRLARGGSRDLATPLAPGRYRLRRRGQEASAFIDVVASLPPGERVEWGPGLAPSRSEIGPDPIFGLRAAADAEEVFVLEEEAWDGDALLPVHIFNMQDFRDLFSEESLASGVRLFVGEQTILFTDIVGSTRLYAEAGDPAAFTQVKRHFAAIYEQVAAHSGVVVKTIGDAVMAAFSDPVNAIAAARDIHVRFPGAKNGGSSVRLRISIHTGPCIAVNLNSGIDYFGGTVNTAAKLQRCAAAGEAALSEAVQRAPGVAEALRLYGGGLRGEVLEHDALGRLRVAVWVPTAGERAAGAA